MVGYQLHLLPFGNMLISIIHCTGPGGGGSSKEASFFGDCVVRFLCLCLTWEGKCCRHIYISLELSVYLKHGFITLDDIFPDSTA